MTTLTIEAAEDNNLYLREQIASGEFNNYQFSLTSTAGYGGITFILEVQRDDGKWYYESFDFQPALREWVEEVTDKLGAEDD